MDIGRDHFYVTLFSNPSIDLEPDNTRAVFTTHLAHPTDLGTSSKWEVGVFEISYWGPSNELVKPNTLVDKTMVFVYCDLVAPQFVADENLRTLRIIHYPSIVGEHRFQNVYYLPVEKRVFRDINIQMRLMDGSAVPFEAVILPVKMVLHFRRVV